MGKNDVINLIKDFHRALENQKIKAQKIILYGSWANGTAHENSDIDLVVISDDFEGKDYWDRINILSEAIYQVFAPFEVIAMTTKEWESKEQGIYEYAKEGEVIQI